MPTPEFLEIVDISTDIDDSWLHIAVPTRKIARRISSTFWFIREILPYGKDCVVVSPDSVRSRIGSELRDAVNNYVTNSTKLRWNC